MSQYKYVIVRNELSTAINDAISREINKLPELERGQAEADRHVLYSSLLRYYDEHGRIPSFMLTKDQSQ